LRARKHLDFLARENKILTSRQRKDQTVALELFEVLEGKLEQILNQYQALQNENTTLMKMLEEQEKALVETREALNKLNRERDVIRQRLDQLLHKLEVLGAEK
jgi:cell division protein ZapB